jgi:hypothetical protein
MLREIISLWIYPPVCYGFDPELLAWINLLKLLIIEFGRYFAVLNRPFLAIHLSVSGEGGG